MLSPALFLLVMDPLLRQLQASGLGLTINKYYAGGYMHADDIRTLATSEETLTRRIAVANSNPFSLSGRTVLALSQDINSLCLVKECRELEEGFGTHFTDEILARREVHPKDIRAAIHDRDLQQNAAKCSGKAPIIAEVANRVGWSKLWDVAMDLGVRAAMS